MSYEDYRTGRPPRRSLQPSYSADFGHVSSPRLSSNSQQSRHRSDSIPSQSGSTPAPAASMASLRPNNNASSAFDSSVRNTQTTNASSRVENPYLTNAYATSRAGASSGPSDSYGNGGGGGADFLASGAKPKGNLQGKFKDTLKNSMAYMKSDNWKVVCVKATSHEVAAPKGKHVRHIMEAINIGSLSNRNSPSGAVLYHMRKRMAINEWVVTLKAQTIFHHIFRDGPEKFVVSIATNARTLFRMEFFSDASPEGFTHGAFIRSYGTYIEQWLAMKAAVKFPRGRAKDDDPTVTRVYREANIQDLLAAMPVLMDTLQAMFKIQLSGATRYTPVALPAISMILRDLSILWVGLSEGMVRMLDLYFSLEKNDAEIALDVYKRFVTVVEESKPFFDMAKGLNSRWKVPLLGAISLELLELMVGYIEKGPEKPDNNPPEFSDEEQYDEPEPEPEPEPMPEDYYEPEPIYYSEEEIDYFPSAPQDHVRQPPVYESEEESSSEEESESEESESEEEDEVDDEAAALPEVKPVNKPLDPLADLLGIDSTPVPQIDTPGGGGVPTAPSMALQVYGAGGAAPGMGMMGGMYGGGSVGVEQSFDERVSSVKGMMAGAGTGGAMNGFGVTGTNMQNAMYGNKGGQGQQMAQGMTPQQQMQQQQQQMYNTMAMQQQQQQMAAYQSMAAYQTMAHNQQMVLYQQMQQQSMANGMNNMNMNRMGSMMGGGGGAMAVGPYVPTPQGNQAVPVMRAQVAQNSGSYRVQKGTKPTRINDSDSAFGPLLDQMKNTGIGK